VKKAPSVVECAVLMIVGFMFGRMLPLDHTNITVNRCSNLEIRTNSLVNAVQCWKALKQRDHEGLLRVLRQPACGITAHCTAAKRVRFVVEP
jgi:hypothetical protein